MIWTLVLVAVLAGRHAYGGVLGTRSSPRAVRDRPARARLVIAIVVVAAFLPVMATFRSVLLAVKAAVLNLLSIGSAYGGLVAVFQWGWWLPRRLDRVLPHVEAEGVE